MSKCLEPLHTGLSWQTLQGTSAPATTLLRSPATGAPCVYWRLRITETLAPTVFVHEFCSDEAFEIETTTHEALPAQRVRINSSEARIDTLAVLHRPDSAAAQAVGLAFGLTGTLAVEEIVIPHGAALEVSGVLVAGQPTDPFRSAHSEYPLAQVTVRVPGMLRGRQMLPWVLGTGAALLGVFGAAVAIARSADVLPLGRTLVGAFLHSEMQRPKPPIPRWP